MKFKEWMSDEDKTALRNFVKFVTEKHDDQWRKDSHLPYIVHPLSVMEQLSGWDIFCPKTWLTGLGHDLFEECPDLLQDKSPVEELAGKSVVYFIDELTFIPNPLDDREPHFQKRDYMKGWLQRDDHGGYEKSVESLVVKIADRVCNVWDFIQTNPSYAPKYFKKAKDLFEAMMSRHEEITERYSPTTFPLMRHTFTELNSVLT